MRLPGSNKGLRLLDIELPLLVASVQKHSDITLPEKG